VSYLFCCINHKSRKRAPKSWIKVLYVYTLLPCPRYPHILVHKSWNIVPLACALFFLLRLTMTGVPGCPLMHQPREQNFLNYFFLDLQVTVNSDTISVCMGWWWFLDAVARELMHLSHVYMCPCIPPLFFCVRQWIVSISFLWDNGGPLVYQVGSLLICVTRWVMYGFTSHCPPSLPPPPEMTVIATPGKAASQRRHKETSVLCRPWRGQRCKWNHRACLRYCSFVENGGSFADNSWQRVDARWHGSHLVYTTVAGTVFFLWYSIQKNLLIYGYVMWHICMSVCVCLCLCVFVYLCVREREREIEREREREPQWVFSCNNFSGMNE